VGTLGDLARLGGFADRPLGGVIVGRALYERRFTVAEALDALAGNERED
jgi:phosphoribosylformimino-5-aminoimidazole carboxamide ribonucleotide (ProFAR) isomerase